MVVSLKILVKTHKHGSVNRDSGKNRFWRPFHYNLNIQIILTRVLLELCIYLPLELEDVKLPLYKVKVSHFLAP